MALKTTPKKLHMGYELRVNETGDSGAKNWRRVGDGDGLFPSSYAANQYREKHFPNVKKWTVMGIKVAAIPKDQEGFIMTSERKDDSKKKGTHNAVK